MHHAVRGVTDAHPLSDSLAEQMDRLRAMAPAAPDEAPSPLAEEARHGVEAARLAWWNAHVPSRFQWASLEDYEPGTTVTGRLSDWAGGPRGRNLVVLGPIGTGKTHAVFAACRPLVLEKGYDFKFCPVVDMLDDLRPGGTEGAAERLRSADLLALDDLGAQKGTEWAHERLYALVNRRWMDERPTVATSNFIPRKMAPQGYTGPFWEDLDERLRSRLAGSGAVVVVLGGEDRRKR